MTAVIVISVIFLLFVVAVIINTVTKRKEQRDLIEDVLDDNDDFYASKVIRQDESTIFYFGVDEKREEIICVSNCKHVRFNYEDIVLAEIAVDNNITETHKSPSLGGAVVGGIIGGGLGAVVGGTNMGTSKSVSKVTNITVHLLLRNTDTEYFDIICLDDYNGVERRSGLYKQSYSQAQAIFDSLRLAMDKVKFNPHKSDKKVKEKEKSFVEELKELAELKQQGLITEEEFAVMKAKIINK